jgi:nitrate reductase molybdenum cofactor assembly chaperone NarJ/NarW
VTYSELADRLRYPDDSEGQELYVKTFEFNPAATLEIGWHLFGENYERGEFLVRMREELRRYGIAEGSDLPDHLASVLRLLATLPHDEAAELVGLNVTPALAKIRAALADNPYDALMAEIEARLAADFPDAPTRPTQLPIFQEALLHE